MKERRLGILSTMLILTIVAGTWLMLITRSFGLSVVTVAPLLILTFVFVEWANGNEVIRGWPTGSARRSKRDASETNSKEKGKPR
jgi:hypothetical protein